MRLFVLVISHIKSSLYNIQRINTASNHYFEVMSTEQIRKSLSLMCVA